MPNEGCSSYWRIRRPFARRRKLIRYRHEHWEGRSAEYLDTRRDSVNRLCDSVEYSVKTSIFGVTNPSRKTHGRLSWLQAAFWTEVYCCNDFQYTSVSSRAACTVRKGIAAIETHGDNSSTS